MIAGSGARVYSRVCNWMGHLFRTDGGSMSALLNVILLFIMKTTQGIAGARVYVRMRIAHLPVNNGGIISTQNGIISQYLFRRGETRDNFATLFRQYNINV